MDCGSGGQGAEQRDGPSPLPGANCGQTFADAQTGERRRGWPDARQIVRMHDALGDAERTGGNGEPTTENDRRRHVGRRTEPATSKDHKPADQREGQEPGDL